MSERGSVEEIVLQPIPPRLDGESDISRKNDDAGIVEVVQATMADADNQPTYDGRRVIFPEAFQSDEGAKPQKPAEPFATNRIKTTKYSLIPIFPDFFLWRMLFEQFQRLANIYFLLIGSLQVIPGISPTGKYTTLSTLVAVLTFSMAKSGYEDVQRYKKDKETNGRKAFVLSKKDRAWVEVSYTDIKVGDIIRIMNVDDGAGNRANDLPADLAVLTTSDPEGLCFVETANLDGETNLKARRALDLTRVDPATLGDSSGVFKGTVGSLADAASHSSSNFERAGLGPVGNGDYDSERHHISDAEINARQARILRERSRTETEALLPVLFQLYDGMIVESETPSNSLYSFTGNLILPQCASGKVGLGLDQMLFRGCLLRKVHWVVGVVVYTGAETKVMMNARKPPHKASRVERLLNKLLLSVLALQLLLCVLSACFFSFSHPARHWYLDSHKALGVKEGFLAFLTFLILFNNLIPISLYVSVEMIKFFQGRLLEQDLTMYYQQKDMRANAKTTDLNEELGQISHVFSDKTGTLTRNVMTFLKFSTHDEMFGTGTTEIGRAAAKRSGKVVNDPRPESIVNSDFPFFDPDLAPGKVTLKKNSEDIARLFEILSLCHTVVMDAGKLEAESPDEEALVKAAGHFGYSFVSRSSTSMKVFHNVTQKSVAYDVLETIPFSSSRKRMSVIVRNPKNRQVHLFTKGADNVIFARLKNGVDTTFVREALRGFGDEGLRTLVIAQRELPDGMYEEWLQKYKATKCIIGQPDFRDAELYRLAELIEVDLSLVGTTALEDKLQLGVASTVEALRVTGLKVWVLTGDKVETAINIGFACALLHDRMNIIVAAEVESSAKLQQTLTAYPKQEGVDLALVIDGDALARVFEDESETLATALYEMTTRCTSVVCCRVSPKQKAQVVELVRSRCPTAVTLSIGDGANDVPMIQAAHCGVGISGMEGQQAANAADYSIGQFRFLHRLTLVHGRANYQRLTLVINYFFYKNALLVLTQFWFCIFNMWTGQSLYEQWTLVGYNVAFTSFPCIIVGIFDREVLNTDNVHEYPTLYAAGLHGEHFNIRVFLQWILTAIVHSAICFFTVAYGWYNRIQRDGNVMGLDGVGVTVYTIVVFLATFKLALHCHSFSWMQHLLLWGSIAAYLVFLALYGQLPAWLNTSMYNILQNVGLSIPPWLIFGVALLFCLLRDLFWKYTAYQLVPLGRMTLARLVALSSARDHKADVRPPLELLAGRERHGDAEQLFTNKELEEEVKDYTQNGLMQFFDNDVEDHFIVTYLGTLARYKIGVLVTFLGSAAIFAVYMFTDVPLLSRIMWGAFAGVALLFLGVLQIGGTRLIPALHGLMSVLMVVGFSCMSIANFKSSAATPDTHPVTFGVILLGLITVVRPPFMHAMHYVLISLIAFVVWYQFFPVPAWEARDFIQRIVEIIVVAVTALIALASSEVFMRQMFISQQQVLTSRKRAEIEEVRSLRLLGNVLPGAIVQEVRVNKRQLEQFSVTYREASLLNSDIVKFTNFSSTKEPHVVVEMLNRLFTKWDTWAVTLGLEKIKTIGDAYICAGGIPIPDPLHQEKIVCMGFAMVEGVRQLNTEGLASEHDRLNIQIRVGTATGPVRAGVVGRQKVCYDVFGHTAHESEEMEQSGLPDRVQCSPTLTAELRRKQRFAFETLPHPERGEQHFVLGTLSEAHDLVERLSLDQGFAPLGYVPYRQELDRQDMYRFLDDDDLQRQEAIKLWTNFSGTTGCCGLSFVDNAPAEEEFARYFRELADEKGESELWNAVFVFVISLLAVGLYITQYTNAILIALAAASLVHLVALACYKVHLLRGALEDDGKTGGAGPGPGAGEDDNGDGDEANDADMESISVRLSKARSLAVPVERTEKSQRSVVARVLSALSAIVAMLVPIGVLLLVNNKGIGTVSVFIVLAVAIYVLSFLHLRILQKLAVIVTYFILVSLAFAYAMAVRHKIDAVKNGGDYFAIFLCSVLTYLAAYDVESSVRGSFAAAKRLIAENGEVESAVALCDKLLNNVLPRSIVRRMKLRPDESVVDEVDDASVLFIYLQGLVSYDDDFDASGQLDESSALNTVRQMNEALFILDALCVAHCVEKIKTAPFLVVAGCPEKDLQHCERIAKFALDVAFNIDQYNREKKLNLKYRIGIHTGKVTAGVLGTSKFLYDVFGDTVNTASRLTSSAEWGTIQLSEVTANRLQARGMRVVHKGSMVLKGKGSQEVYLLEKAVPNASSSEPSSRPVSRQRGPNGREGLQVLTLNPNLPGQVPAAADSANRSPERAPSAKGTHRPK